ncbi:hypothetical protein [Bacillus sp. Marseille-Q1617]|uniref:hypothetical protein n=1 Tax=Bacillus sp. Marseille-Q1617 TaxID=2736887 RepID=UPI00158948E8|nr:hypothetical protein [Bacillus sp. Marseille-Q1617]
MSMLLMFLPIFIILALVAGVGTFMVKASRRKRVGSKKTRWVIGGYTLVLLVAAIVSSSVLPDNGEGLKTVSAVEMKRIESEQMRVLDAAHSGTLESVGIDGVYTEKKSWSFPYDQPKLDITHLDEEASTVMVFVEKKVSDDGVIEAVHFTGNIFIDGMDMTDKKSSPILELSGKILSIKAPEMVYVNMTKFSSGFPFQQFSGEKNWYFGERPSMGFGQDFILLKVPNDVEIDGHTNYVRAE